MGTTEHAGVEVMLDDQEAFVSAAVHGRRRVLEVGCGSGLLAARLAGAGHEVIGIDLHLPAELPVRAGLAFAEADVRAFTARPFDAVAFTASLHHVAPLDRALDRAVALCARGGRLVVDDFDLDAPDLATLRWYYDAHEVLAAAGVCDVAHLDGAPDDDPRARWRAGHAPHHPDEAPLHGGDAMIEGIEARFEDVKIARGPFLWRRIARGASGPQAGAIARALLAAEERGIVAGTLRPVGLRITARRA